jgi:hypothetical protein
MKLTNSINKSPTSDVTFEIRNASLVYLRPTQPLIQRVPGVPSLGIKRDWGVMLTSNLHLLPRSKIKQDLYLLSPLRLTVCSGTALSFLYTSYTVRAMLAVASLLMDVFGKPKQETGGRTCITWEIHSGTECYSSSMNISDKGHKHNIRT